MFLSHQPLLRIGRFRYSTTIWEYGIVSFFGPLAVILFVTFFKTIELWLPFHILPVMITSSLFKFGMYYAVLNLLPFPPLDGSKLLYSSRLTYAFLFGTVFGYVMLFLLAGIYSYIFALVIGGLFWLAFLIFFERGVS